MTGTITRAADATAEWRDPLARVGLVAKGALYVTLGILAIQFARGTSSGADVSQTGAIERVAAQPFGRVLLVALTVGLACLTVWHVIQAFTGDPVEGDEPTDRAKYAGKAAVHGALAATAAKITVDTWSSGETSASGGGSDNAQSQEAASTLFDLPGGTMLVVFAGLALIGIALYQFVMYVVRTEHMDRIVGAGRATGALRAFGRIGYASRAIVLGICGGFFLVAAVQHDPSESKGMSGALQELSERGWGQLLLWLVAVGFLLFGVFCVAEAKLRRAA